MISVFGGTGFIGSRFCELNREDVRLIHRETNVPFSGHQVLYLISTTDNYNVLSNPQLDIDTNLSKLVKVLENCKDSDVTFNFVSSWFVYGDVKLPAKESSYCNPKGFYSITKRTAEQLLISYCETFNIKYRIFRLCNVIGKGDKGVGKKKNALQYLVNEVKENRDVNLYYGGYFKRDYLHVDDVCEAMSLLINRESPENEIYNIGSGNGYKFIDLMNYCKIKLYSRSNFNTIDAPAFHKQIQVKDMYLDISKLDNFCKRNSGKHFITKYTIWEALDDVMKNENN